MPCSLIVAFATENVQIIVSNKGMEEKNISL
jgi:hypothetical protein